jgi:Baseplate J-like protein
MEPKDRKSQLLQSSAWNGIDFVEVANDAQTELRVHFLNGVALQAPISTPTITGGESIPTVNVNSISASDWQTDSGGHVILNLSVAAPGDFSYYTLAISSPNLDSFFASSVFSFKDRCPTTLDCQPAEPACPEPEVSVPPIDYLAKDFLSFRQALLDFSALRYPEWQERSEADFGVMFAEALSGMADDLSYMQDRVASEAALETVTQRRSLVRLARMVDYEPARATAATVMLQFDVGPGVSSVAHGIKVSAPGPDGTPVVFETGGGLLEVLIDPATGVRRAAPPVSIASPLWNSGLIQPYWLDDSQRCLPAGSTSMNVLGHGYDLQPGQSLLITTQGATSADPPICQIVQLIAASGATLPATELCDPLFLAPASSSGPPFLTCEVSPADSMAPTAYTTIVWSNGLQSDCDLTVTTVCGNLVPATQGQTVAAETFAIGAFATGTLPPGETVAPAIVRTGPTPLPSTVTCAAPAATPQYLYCLRNASRLTWLTPDTVSPDANPVPTDPSSSPLQLPSTKPDPLPELLLEQISGNAPPPWVFDRTLLDAAMFDTAYTLDEVRYQPIVVNSDGSTQYEYAGDSGDTIRFGDGTFGTIPLEGTLFQATYRVGGGSNGNVAAGAISQIDPSAVGNLMAVTNPLAACGGADEETAESVQRFAPQKFRQVQYRAVIPQDYQNAAETLPWVTRAGTVSRWTGSWLTLFTTPDPLDSEYVTLTQQTQLIDLLNRYRMAGYESYVPAPQYVSLDIEVQVCAQANAFRGDVETAVLAQLNPSSIVNRQTGFFDPDHFTFGVPLERSRLEAAVQNAAGVSGVLCIHYRNRSRSQVYVEMPDEVTVGTNQIIRCDNDPSVPEHGSIQITVMGGK